MLKAIGMAIDDKISKVIGFLLFGPIYGIIGLTLVLISAYVWEAVFLFI